MNDTTTIVMTGGGSGGHITPILAVAAELKKLQPHCTVVYIGQKGDGLQDIPAKNPSIDAVYSVRAGKWRRYHGHGLRQLFYFRTVALNLRDVCWVLIGLVQSYRLLRKLRPSCVFVKGGFVGVPVGLAAAARHVPYVTHDSDAIPGLANRLIARWARLHTVALPKEIYAYPTDKTVTVGVPVDASYQRVTPSLLQKYRAELDLADYQQTICVTGGGNGARALNRIVIAASPDLLAAFPQLAIVHIAGRSLEKETTKGYDAVLAADERPRVMVRGFVTDLFRYSGAADVVVARGGATNLAEFALQAKPCVIVPSPQLLWNVRNTEALAQRQAVIKIDEAALAKDGSIFLREVTQLLADDKLRTALGDRLAAFAQPAAAHRLAMILLEQARASRSNKN